MKKTVLTAMLLLLTVFLAGCGGDAARKTSEPTQNPAMTLQEKVEKAAADARDLVPLTDEDLLDVLGIEPEEYSDFVYLQENGLGGREILVIRAADNDAAGRVKQRVENYLEQRRLETQNYLPAAYQLLRAAKVETKGLTVALFVGEKAAEETKAVLAGE